MRKEREEQTFLERISFQWRGRTREGVSKWIGNWDGPSPWMSKGFIGYGILAGCAGIVAAISSTLLHQGGPGVGTFAMVGLIHGAVFTTIGLWMLRVRRHIQSLNQTNEVCEALGIDEATLLQIAAKRGIKPKLILNNQPLYSLTDFSDEE